MITQSLLTLRVSHHKFFKLYDSASLLTLRVSHHKFFKLYDNASLLTLRVSHQLTRPPRTPYSPRFTILMHLPSLRFKVRDTSLTGFHPSHSTCVPILHKLFNASVNRRRYHVTAPRCSIASSLKRSPAFVSLAGHVLLRPPLPRSLQTSFNAIITTP